MSIFDDDLSYITGDVFSSPVVFGSQSTKGILSRQEPSQPNGEDLYNERRGYTLELPANALSPFPALEDTITIAGVQYVVRDIDPSMDGRLSTLTVQPKVP